MPMPPSEEVYKICLEIWAISHDNSGTQAHVRNLYWEGYHFYSVVDSPEYGSAYFGSGVPILDISFML